MEYQSTNSKEGNLKLQSNCSIQSTNGTVQSGYSEESLIMSNQIHENKDNKFTQNDKHLNSTCSIQSTDGTVQNNCTDQTTLNRQNQNLSGLKVKTGPNIDLCKQFNRGCSIQSAQCTVHNSSSDLNSHSKYEDNRQFTKQKEAEITTNMQNGVSNCKIIPQENFEQNECFKNNSVTALSNLEQGSGDRNCGHQQCPGNATCNPVHCLENEAENLERCSGNISNLKCCLKSNILEQPSEKDWQSTAVLRCCNQQSCAVLEDCHRKPWTLFRK